MRLSTSRPVILAESPGSQQKNFYARFQHHEIDREQFFLAVICDHGRLKRMSSSTPTQSCTLKARLLKEIGDAIKLMISYHQAELERLSRGELPAFD